jgi:uncharacterized protein (TIGR03067 family)
VGVWKAADGKDRRVRFDTDGRFKVWSGSAEGSGTEYTWVVDETTTPRQLTLKGGFTYDGVYELTAERLRIALDHAGRRPEKVADTGGGVQYFDLVRDTTNR